MPSRSFFVLPPKAFCTFLFRHAFLGWDRHTWTLGACSPAGRYYEQQLPADYLAASTRTSRFVNHLYHRQLRVLSSFNSSFWVFFKGVFLQGYRLHCLFWVCCFWLRILLDLLKFKQGLLLPRGKGEKRCGRIEVQLCLFFQVPFGSNDILAPFPNPNTYKSPSQPSLPSFSSPFQQAFLKHNHAKLWKNLLRIFPCGDPTRLDTASI